MDIFIAVILSVLQLLAAVAGIFVTLRPPPRERHIRYLFLFIVLGVGGILLVGVQAKRAADQQEANKAQLGGIGTVGQRTEGKVDKLLLNAAPSQPCPLPSVPHVKKRGKRSGQALATNPAVGDKRAITAAESVALVEKLSRTPAKVSVTAQMGDGEAFKFAQQLANILQQAGWQV